MGSTMARVGSIVSPLVSMTAEFYPSMPLFIFGAVPVAASAVTTLLPETLGQPLPDTVQDLKSRWAPPAQRIGVLLQVTHPGWDSTEAQTQDFSSRSEFSPFIP